MSKAETVTAKPVIAWAVRIPSDQYRNLYYLPSIRTTEVAAIKAFQSCEMLRWEENKELGCVVEEVVILKKSYYDQLAEAAETGECECGKVVPASELALFESGETVCNECVLQSRIAQLEEQLKPFKGYQPITTNCDYRGCHCTNKGTVINGQWFCENHAPRVEGKEESK